MWGVCFCNFYCLAKFKLRHFKNKFIAHGMAKFFIWLLHQNKDQSVYTGIKITWVAKLHFSNYSGTRICFPDSGFSMDWSWLLLTLPKSLSPLCIWMGASPVVANRGNKALYSVFDTRMGMGIASAPLPASLFGTFLCPTSFCCFQPQFFSYCCNWEEMKLAISLFKVTLF